MAKPDETLTSNPLKIDVSRLDLRVGEVNLVKEHPFDKKYFLIYINVDEEKERRSTSRLGHLLVRQQIDRQKVVVLCNVKGMVQGIRSNCFILFGRSGSMAELLVPPGDADPGQRVYVPGYPFDPFQDLPYLSPDEEGKRIFSEAAKHFKVGRKDGIVKYKGTPLKTVVEGEFELKPYTLWGIKI